MVNFQLRILLGVFSGLTLSGKSFFRNWAMDLPEYKNAMFVATDDVRQRLWSTRSGFLTKTEYLFNNEATRFEVKTRLIVEAPSAVFLEMVMLTREAHQRPFVEMVQSANQYLWAIEREEAARDGKPIPESPITVDFRCIYFYCDMEAVKRRIGYRQRELETIGNASSTDVFNFDGFLLGARQIEIPPAGYTPLYINTSDESQEALARQREEVLSFLKGEMPVSEGELQRRASEAMTILDKVSRS